MDASEQLPTTGHSEQKGEQIATSPSADGNHPGQTRRALLSFGRGLSVLHRIVDRDADSGDFDDADAVMDDDDTYSVSSMGSHEDDDIGEPEEGDLAMDEEEYPESSTHQLQGESHSGSGAPGVQAAPIFAAGALGPAGTARDPNSARTRFVPERPAPSTTPANQATANSPTSPKAKATDAPKARNLNPTTAPSSVAENQTARPSPALATKESVPTKPAAAATAKPDPLAPTEAAPYGYKIVKVKKADGTIAKVKRPLKEGETYTPPRTTASPPKTGAGSNAPVSSKDAEITPAASPATTQDSSNPQATKSKAEIIVTEKEITQDRQSETDKSQQNTVTHKTWNFVQMASWMVMIVFPGLFLALAIWAAVENQKLVPEVSPLFGGSSDEGSGFTSLGKDPLTQAKTTAVSLWPIVFAAVVASTLKAYAAFKVEQGISLVTLEQLISSHSVGAAIKQPFMLRKFNWATLGLFVMWCLSPLAGQGIQRMVVTKSADVIDTGRHVAYFAPQQFPREAMALTFPYNDTEMRLPDEFPRLETIYSSLQLGSVKAQNASQDIWGNIKIPVYEGGAHEGSFTSLLGIPWNNPSPNTTTDGLTMFNLTSTYFTMDCTGFELHNLTTPAMRALNFSSSPSRTLYLSAENDTSIKFTNPDWVAANETGTLFPNTTNATFGQFYPYEAPGVEGVIHLGSLQYNQKYIVNSDGELVAPDSPFGDNNSFDASKAAIWYSKCPYKQVMVTSEVWCWSSAESFGSSCHVVSQELNKTASKSDFLPIQPLFVKAMLSMNGHDVGDKRARFEYTDTEQFLLNPYFATNGSTALEMNELSPQAISSRFGVLVNTLWLAGTDFNPFLGFNGSLPDNTSATFEDFTHLKYVVSWPWFSSVVICSSLLIVAGIAAAAFEFRTIGPDFLGFANTAIKRSVKLPKDMSTMNARDRLAALQECEVLLQDVRPNAQRGKIALGVKEQTSTRLVLGRDYV